jgi:hypothetical protein
MYDVSYVSNLTKRKNKELELEFMEEQGWV